MIMHLSFLRRNMYSSIDNQVKDLIQLIFSLIHVQPDDKFISFRHASESTLEISLTQKNWYSSQDITEMVVRECYNVFSVKWLSPDYRNAKLNYLEYSLFIKSSLKRRFAVPRIRPNRNELPKSLMIDLVSLGNATVMSCPKA